MYMTEDVYRAAQLNQQGIMLYGRGRPDLAMKAFQQAVAMAPDFADARVSLSRMLLESYDLLGAEEQLSIALDLPMGPATHQAALVNLASVCYHQKAYRRAIELLQRASNVLPADNEICYNLGSCNLEIGEWEEAERQFRMSLSLGHTPRAEVALERMRVRSKPSDETNALRTRLYGDLTHHQKEENKDSLQFPACGEDILPEPAARQIKDLLADKRKIAFFVGAGISFPRPACLPMAGTILKEIFRFMTLVDGLTLIEAGLPFPEQEQMALELTEKPYLPFEISFQALQDVFGNPVLSFVDLLQSGKPNLHHKMFAHAIRQGHTVITTNFDDKIERAYRDLFGSDEGMTILVTDKEFQSANDRGLDGGVLAKIHGDLNDYNSLALTIEGLAVRADKTLATKDIGVEKGLREVQLAFAETLLSVPKTLYLQHAIDENLMVFMGYSGSDIYDIMPVLQSAEFTGPGIWVMHSREPSGAVPEGIKKWMSQNNRRLALQPEKNAVIDAATGVEKRVDFTSMVSRYFLDYFDIPAEKSAKPGWFGKLVAPPEDKPSTTFYSSFDQWLDRLRVHPGDGAAWLGKLYSRHAKWEKAARFYQVAAAAYDQQGNQMNALRAHMNRGVMLKDMGGDENKKEADSIFSEVKTIIECSENPALYAPLHVMVLLNLANNCLEADEREECLALLHKARQIASEVNDLASLCISYRIEAQHYFHLKDYEHALALYMKVFQLAGDILGDMIEACLACAQGGICMIKLGQYPAAGELLARADMYARNLGDEDLTNLVLSGRSLLAEATRKASPVSQNFHQKLIEDAKTQLKALHADECEVDNLLGMISNQRYEVALKTIDSMQSRYTNEKVQALLMFVASNIHHRMNQFEQEIQWLEKFEELNPECQNIPQVQMNFAVAYQQLKKYEKSEQSFIRAIELMGGTYPLAHCNLGLLYVEMGDMEKAKEQLEKAEQSHAPDFSLQALRRHLE